MPHACDQGVEEELSVEKEKEKEEKGKGYSRKLEVLSSMIWGQPLVAKQWRQCTLSRPAAYGWQCKLQITTASRLS